MMAYAIGATAPLMSKFSMVFQDVVLFNTSIMDNIRIGRKGATDEEVMEAAWKAQYDEFVQRLPEKAIPTSLPSQAFRTADSIALPRASYLDTESPVILVPR